MLHCIEGACTEGASPGGEMYTPEHRPVKGGVWFLEAVAVSPQTRCLVHSRRCFGICCVDDEQRLVQDAVFSSHWKRIPAAEKAIAVQMTLERGSVGSWILEGEKLFTRKHRQESILGGEETVAPPESGPLHSCEGPGTGTCSALCVVRWVGWNSRGKTRV